MGQSLLKSFRAAGLGGRTEQGLVAFLGPEDRSGSLGRLIQSFPPRLPDSLKCFETWALYTPSSGAGQFGIS